MAVQKNSVDLIQQAGAALSAAREALATDFHQATVSMTNAVIASPAGRELDSHFTSVKAIARLAHELAALDDRLKEAYFSAVVLLPQSSGVASAVERTVDIPRAFALSNAGMKAELVEDAVLKAKVGKTKLKVRSAAPPKSTQSPESLGADVQPAKNSVTSAILSGNENKALVFLRKRLSKKYFRKVNSREISEGAGLPQGSVSIALRKLLEKGAVARNETGEFKLI